MLLQMALFHSFLCLCNIPLCMYRQRYHILFIHSTTDGHLDCFHILGTVNSASVNTGVHIAFLSIVFSGYKPMSGIARSYSNYFQFLKESPYCCPQWHQFKLPPIVQEDSLFSTHSPELLFVDFLTIAGRVCGQEEKWTTEDEMAGWHHRLDGLEFE